MRFEELRLFARTEGGACIASDAARALNLPMPEDVLEQFILDHALNDTFQEWYGDLDLYAIAWSQEEVRTRDIIACTSKFDDYVQEVAERHANASTIGTAIFHPDARIHWAQHGTWARAPLFFYDVLPSPDARHLVEGHTRVGAVAGFHANPNPPLRLAATHLCWIGRPTDPVKFDWRSVRRRHPVSFKQWLYDDEIGPGGDIATALSDAEDAHRYDFSLGNDLPDLVEFLERHPMQVLSVARLEALHEKWAEAVEIRAAP